MLPTRLPQWREFTRLARFEPTHGMSAEELEWMRKATSTFPNAGAFHKMAGALAMNQQPEESSVWLRKMCKIVSKDQCDAVKHAWAKQSLSDPDIAAVPWPN